MIGIMDWGIGGLSVYKAMRDRGLTTDVLYFSDSGTTPYGRLSKASLRERFSHIADSFCQRGVAHVLVGCHSASSALNPDAQTGREAFGGVAFESIIPAALRISRRSMARRLGVIGGERTIQSGVYERVLATLGKQLTFCPAQPLSAFVESGDLNSPAVEAEVRRVMEQLGPIEALLIACTHYPALTPIFTKVSPSLELLDPGGEMIASLHDEGSSRFEFFTTGDRGASARAARLAFGIEIDVGTDARATPSSPLP